MTILWINLAIVFILSFFSRCVAVTEYGTVFPITVKPNKFLSACVLLSLALVSGLRSNIGDTYFYKIAYQMGNFTWPYIQSQKDWGFGVLQMILKRYSDDPQILILTTGIITNVLIFMVLYKYSRMIELSMYVYITGGLFLVTMNGMRQCLAAAIVFTATKFLIEGSWKRYILVTLFASMFHASALVLIPIYFLVRNKAWSKTTFMLLALAVVIVLGFNQFSSILFSAIQNTQYGGYQDASEQGANFLRVAVDAVPLLIAYIGRDKLKEIFPQSDYIVNMTIIGFVFMVISTRNWIFARFDIYFDMYQLILISWVVKLFNGKSQRVIYLLLLGCYLYYYYYQDVITLSIDYESNYL